jgi:hypothetical protein
MIVLSNGCKKCNCICNSIYFQQNFKNWTSGNSNIDEFIQDTQLLTHDNVSNALEWIPYDRFYDIEYIDRFEKVYKAKWIDGYINHGWNEYNQDWKRTGENILINLKTLDNPKDVTLKFMNKVLFSEI